MYIPRHFAENDRSTLFGLMRQNSFGLLVTVCDGTPQISHLPFVVDAGEGPDGALYGHFARANPHWKSLLGGDRAMAIFQGPHCYVSPRWYTDQSNVPTWNYTAVHADGELELIEDNSTLLEIVSRLTRIHEDGRENPWPVENTATHLDKLLTAIVGFRIRIESLEGKFKLSQNKTDADRRGVVEALADSADPGEAGVAQLMRQDPQS